MPVYVVAGDDKYMVWRDMETRRESYLQHGYEVLRKTSLEIEEDGSFFGVAPPKKDPALWVFEEDPGSEVLTLEKDDTITVMVCLPGTSGKKLPAWTASLPKKRLRLHESPKPWELQDQASSYVVAEGKALGLEVSAVLAHVMVKLVGADRGILRQELRRVAIALGASKASVKVLTGDHVKSMSHGLGSPEQGDDVAAALMVRDPKKISAAVSRALAQDTSMGGTLRVVAFIRTVLRKWLMASLWRGKGVLGEAVAEKIGMHPYRYKLQVQPALAVWDTESLVAVMGLLGDVEIGCKEGGYLHTAALLEASLIEFCDRS